MVIPVDYIQLWVTIFKLVLGFSFLFFFSRVFDIFLFWRWWPVGSPVETRHAQGGSRWCSCCTRLTCFQQHALVANVRSLEASIVSCRPSRSQSRPPQLSSFLAFNYSDDLFLALFFFLDVSEMNCFLPRIFFFIIFSRLQKRKKLETICQMFRVQNWPKIDKKKKRKEKWKRTKEQIPV